MFYFDSFADFIAMGRHGGYVWSAYGIALAILILMAAAPLRRGKQLRRQIRRRLRRDQASAEAGHGTGAGQGEN